MEKRNAKMAEKMKAKATGKTKTTEKRARSTRPTRMPLMAKYRRNKEEISGVVAMSIATTEMVGMRQGTAEQVNMDECVHPGEG